MLKIKDDVDLKELEKLNFKKYEATHLLYFRKDNHDFACADTRDRKYEILDLCSLSYNLTYDLIKTDILEKV